MDLINTVLQNPLSIPIMGIVFGCTVAVVAIAAGALRSIFVTRARESSRCELAAYVAEGSMDPQTAISLLNAGPREKSEVVSAEAIPPAAPRAPRPAAL